MILNIKTLEQLRDLINEKSEYRSGPVLVDFFNEYGFNDTYGTGFPSRWMYTDEKLKQINGTPELDMCIKKSLSPINFIGEYERLDKLISDFNQYLAFDRWQVIRDNAEIRFEKTDKIVIKPTPDSELKEDEFLHKEFEDISIDKLGFDPLIADTLKARLVEIEKGLSSQAPLSVIFLSGSLLEGALLGIALKHPSAFNQSKSTPKHDGKPKNFQDWKLSNFIDVACDIGFLREDVKKFSHALRDFRNYIHPYEQVSSKFSPDMHTAKICWQVLKAAMHQLSEKA